MYRVGLSSCGFSLTEDNFKKLSQSNVAAIEISIFDKVNQRELLKSGARGNELRAYEDYPDCYDCWEWQAYETDKYKVIDAISKTDKRRSSYYNFYTGNKWGKYDNYDMAINSSTFGIEETAKIIAAAVQKLIDDRAE